MEILSSFEKVVWVSVGQEPDIRGLQNSVHFQLTESFIPDDKTHDDEILHALRNAPARAAVFSTYLARRRIIGCLVVVVLVVVL